MLVCLIDIGNTSIKIAFANQEKILANFSLPTHQGHSGDSLGLCFVQCFQHAKLEGQISACLVSSVVPNFENLIRHAAQHFLLCPVFFVPQDLSFPLENHYARPHEVGADRLVAAFAARRLFPNAKSVISVDYGTATTFDCVTDNAYLGGLICPGVLSSLGALASNTARLPRIALGRERKEGPLQNFLIGKDTATSLQHGFLYGFASMTEGLIARLKHSLEGPVSVVACGGFAKDIAEIVDCFDAVEGDLLLDGLHTVWREGADYLKSC